MNKKTRGQIVKRNTKILAWIVERYNIDWAYCTGATGSEITIQAEYSSKILSQLVKKGYKAQIGDDGYTRMTIGYSIKLTFTE